MRYPYACPSCSHDFEVIKSVAQIDDEESCPKCGATSNRYIARTHFYGATPELAEYNPAFGCIVNSKNHRKELARKFGVEEIGNEPVENIHKQNEKRRKENWEKSWEAV